MWVLIYTVGILPCNFPTRIGKMMLLFSYGWIQDELLSLNRASASTVEFILPIDLCPHV
jgi:hypothetical protein